MKSKKAAQKLGAGAILLIVAIGAIMFTEPGQDFLSSVTPEGQSEDIKITSDIVDTGSAATLAIKAYDAEANSRTEVSPQYLIYRGSTTLVDCATASSTNLNIGDTVKIYGCSEDDTIITEPKTYTVTVAKDQIDLVGHTLVTGSNLAITVYDDTGATALSIDDNESNTADYAGGDIGADEFVTYFVKIKNEEANSAYDFYGWCGYWMNDVDDVIVKSITASTISGAIGQSFTKVSEPEELDDTTVTIYSDTPDFGEVFTTSYKTCWVLDEPITLHEWDSITTKVIAEAGSTGPSANTGDNFGLVAVDKGWNKDKDGNPIYDFYQHDDDEKISDIGLAELILANVSGLEYKVTIELQ